MESEDKNLYYKIGISNRRMKIALLIIILAIQMGSVIQTEAINTQQTNEKKLTIFHVNDIHGWVEPHDGFGGMAHLLTQMETGNHTN